MQVKQVITNYEMFMGSLPKKGYGLAYHKFDPPVSIFYPIPLNVMLKAWRSFYHWMVFSPSKHDTELAITFNKGYEAGLEEGIKRVKDVL